MINLRENPVRIEDAHQRAVVLQVLAGLQVLAVLEVLQVLAVLLLHLSLSQCVMTPSLNRQLFHRKHLILGRQVCPLKLMQQQPLEL